MKYLKWCWELLNDLAEGLTQSGRLDCLTGKEPEEIHQKEIDNTFEQIKEQLKNLEMEN